MKQRITPYTENDIIRLISKEIAIQRFAERCNTNNSIGLTEEGRRFVEETWEQHKADARNLAILIGAIKEFKEEESIVFNTITSSLEL